jgi:hypothetical protein
VYVQSAVIVPSHAVYLYRQTTVPSHAGVGLSCPTNTAVTVLPQASVMFAGAPGSTAALGHDTVELPLAGAVKPPE